MSADIEESWSRVTGWLAAHAPVSYARLRPPASGLDPALPADLRRLLSINDGADPSELTMACFLPGMYRPLPAAEIAQTQATMAEIAAELGEDMIGNWWHPSWVIFTSDGGGDGLVMDSQRGRIGRYIRTDGPIWGAAPSLASFLAETARALETRAELLYTRPHVAHGELTWKPAAD